MRIDIRINAIAFMAVRQTALIGFCALAIGQSNAILSTQARADTPAVYVPKDDSKDSSKPIRLSLDGGPKENTLLVNDGYEEGNTDSDGFSLPDNRPDYLAGDRINPTDDVLRDASLELRLVGRGKWKLTFPTDCMMVWMNVNGTYVKVESNVLSDEVDLPHTMHFKLEGINASDPTDDSVLEAALVPSGGGDTLSDQLPLKVVNPSPDELPGHAIAADGSLAPAAAQTDGTGVVGASSPDSDAPVTEVHHNFFQPYKNTRTWIYSPHHPLSNVKVGDRVRWTLEGPSTLLAGTNASGQPIWSKTVVTTVPGSADPNFFKRPQVEVLPAPGFNTLILTDAKRAVLVQFTITFFTMDELIEINQPCNHIIDPKEPSSTRKHLGDRNALTLYCATEPDHLHFPEDKVQLLLTTNLRKTVGAPKYVWGWALYGDAIMSREYVGTHTQFMDDDGTATVAFHPVDRSIPPHLTPLQAKWDDLYYTVGVGVGNDVGGVQGDGIRSAHWDTTYTTSPKFQVKAFNDNDYQNALDYIQGTVSGWANENGGPFAIFLLDLFVHGTPNQSLYPTSIFNILAYADTGLNPFTSGEVTSSPDTIAASDTRLSHIAGAAFGNGDCSAAITRWRFRSWTHPVSNTGVDSVPAQIIKSSRSFGDFKANKIAQAILQAQAANSPGRYPFECNQNGDPQKGEPISFSFKRFDIDLNVAVNSALLFGDGAVDVIKNADGTFSASNFRFCGYLEDLYDYRDETIGPAPIAAALQIGYRNLFVPGTPTTAGETLRPYGHIFITQVDLNVDDSTDDHRDQFCTY